MELNLHQLRIFYSVAKEGTTYKAANSLHISQLSVSAQLKQFESSIGNDLFRREGRQLILTSFGEQLMFHAEHIFEEEEKILHLITKQDEEKHLNIVGHQLAIEQFIEPVLEDYISNNSNVNVTIGIRSSEQALEMLQKNQVDLAIVGLNPNLYFEIDKKKYQQQLLFEDRFCFIVNQSVELPNFVSLTELNQFSFVGRDESSYSQQLLNQLTKIHSLEEFQTVVTFDNAQRALEYTVNNELVYFCSYELAKGKIATGELKEIILMDEISFSLEHSIYAIFQKNNHKVADFVRNNLLGTK